MTKISISMQFTTKRAGSLRG